MLSLAARPFAVFASLCLVSAAALAQAAEPPVGEVVPGVLLVHHRPEAAPRLRAAWPSVRALTDRITRIDLSGTTLSTVAATALLRADPEVTVVEPDRVRRAHAVVANDPLFSSQWSLPLARIPEAWVRSRGAASVVVAIVDTGIVDHPDLRARLLPGFDFVSSAASAGDGDGRDGDATDTGTLDLSSSGLHGTHMAGIIGAHTDNQLGVAGVDWKCRLLPLRALGIDGARGSDSDISEAIRWAAGFHVDGAPDNLHRAAVINLSFGGEGTSRTLQSAIDDAVGTGAIVVASAGNDAADTARYAPAGLNQVIAVGAADHAGMRTAYSNRGARLDLLAPGGEMNVADGGILSTLLDGQGGFTYARLAGTSQAAPHVSGVIALMRAIDPSASFGASRARAFLVATADVRSRCADGCGGGLLDADAALAAVQASCTDGHCVPPVVPGIVLTSACSITGRPSRGPSPLLLLLAASLVASSRTRSRRRAAAPTRRNPY